MNYKFLPFFVILIIINNHIAIANDYPKSHLEREIDEMGSLLKGEGIVWKPAKERSRSTESPQTGNVNRYLFQASIDVLKFAPLLSADKNSGYIVTHWYTPKGKKNVQFKVTIHINDNLISPESIDVKAFQRDKNTDGWSDKKQSDISIYLEDKIIRKARDLYLEHKKEK